MGCMQAVVGGKKRTRFPTDECDVITGGPPWKEQTPRDVKVLRERH